jgi:mRNA interferase MazF
MARLLRGEIRWADLNPARGHEQAGLRPVLILSHDIFNESITSNYVDLSRIPW